MLAGPLAYFSKSMTAMVLLVTGLFTATFIAYYYKRQFSVHWIFLTLLVMMVSAYIFKADLLSLVGKSETLTGRTITWAIVYEQAKMMPLFGHNGYLDIFFWFGVFVFGVFIVDIAKKLYILLHNKYDYSSLVFLSVFFIMFVIANIAESLILVRSGLTWTLFVIVIFKTNERY